MNEPQKLPPIYELSAISPEEQANGTLVSPNIDARVEEYTEWLGDAWHVFNNAEPGSIEEETAARKIATISLLKTSQKLASPHEIFRAKKGREDWVQRFTEGSSELYHPPIISTVQTIISQEAAIFEDQSGTYIDVLNNQYASFLMNTPNNVTELTESAHIEYESEQYNQLKDSFIEMNHDWFDYLDENPRDRYDAAELTELFSELITLRAEKDPMWNVLSAELEPQKSIVHVEGKQGKVFVGENRPAVNNAEARALVAHELGVHAQRYVNGLKIGQEDALPGYLEFEESLGIFSEYLVTGQMPKKAMDRYVDIALALGLIPENNFSRQELIEFAVLRDLARQELQGRAIDDDIKEAARQKATVHVNRIFRGGDGSASEDTQAIFTKDAVYYPANVQKYLSERLQSGVDARSLFDYILSAKFDPTNTRHAKKINSLYPTNQ